LFTISACKIRVEKIKPFGINDQHFELDRVLPVAGLCFVICCNGTVSTPSVELDKGGYVILVRARGSQAAGIYPLLRVRLNDQPLQDVQLDSNFTEHQIPFLLKEKETVRVRMVFDQDAVDEQQHDRNIFIRRLMVVPAVRFLWRKNNNYFP